MTLRFLLVLALLACSGNAPSFPAGYIEPELPDKMLVVGDAFYMSWNEWTNSPFYRVSDSVTLPKYVMLNAFRQGCIVPSQVWALQPRRIACPTGWRHWRGPTR